MILTRTVDPASEPLDLETEIKPQLRVDINGDDDYLTNVLLPAAREYVEETARRALITQTWRLSLANWPAGNEIELPRPPLQSVTSVVYYDSDGNSNTLSSSAYDVDTDSEPGRVVLAYGESWPSATLRPMNPIQITFVAGYGLAAAVPLRWKQAMLLLIGHWYENREDTITGTIIKDIPLGVDSLIWLDRG